MSGPDTKASQGFVLINALVIVAALAALAAALLMRADQGRLRLEGGQVSDQLSLGLEAFDALAMELLARDGGASDHLGEAWARPLPPLPLARGTVAGEIEDLQGRFNLNWLSDPENRMAQAAFARLLRDLALPPQTAELIQTYVTPGALAGDDLARARWRQQQPPQDPIGGPLFTADQLATLPGLPEQSYVRLRPLVTALPGDSRINVNTAAPQLLAAVLPHLSPAELSRLLRRRQNRPYASVEAFLADAKLPAAGEGQDATEAPAEDDDTPRLRPEQLSVSSEWFHLSAEARLDGASARRSALLRRRASGQRPELVWHINRHP